jgi:5-methylcytosine-specific restriction endonuclease McrA
MNSYARGMAVSQSRRARAARRRTRRVALADNDLTPVQWAAIQLAWGGGCAYCGTVATGLQRDCVLPISRGGRYTLENVVPACRSCNASKSNDEVTGWLRRKRLDEAAFLLRYRSTVLALIAPADTDPGDGDPQLP